MRRLYLVIADEWVYHPRFVSDLAAGCQARGWQILGLTRAAAPARTARQVWQAVRRDMMILGAWPFFRLGCQQLWYRAADPWRRPGRPSLTGAARRGSFPIRWARDVNAPEHVAYVRALAPDVLVSSNGQKFLSALLAVPTIACINRHSALLPKYRGVWPVFWALLRGEREIGVSVHYMTPDYDAGDIIAQAAIPIEMGDTLAGVYHKAFARSGAVVLEALDRLAQSARYVMKRNDPAMASCFSYPAPAEAAAFHRRFRIC